MNPWSMPSVFLAGSIDMGSAEDWQAQFERFLSDLDVLILNPRRDEWDASWEQSITNPLFREQVEWELTGLERKSLNSDESIVAAVCGAKALDLRRAAIAVGQFHRHELR